MRTPFESAAFEVKDPAMAYMAGRLAILRQNSPKQELVEAGLDYVDLVGSLYTAEERALLRTLGERFPRIKLGFSYFGLLPSNQRPFEALAVNKLQPRSGWLRIGVPGGWVQSVDDHHKSCIVLARLVFRDDPDLETICKILQHHDIGEPVIGDFTPHCPITKAEKIAAEEMAVRLVTIAHTRGNPLAADMRYSFHAYEGMIPGMDALREKAKDIDLLEMILEIPMIRGKCPIEERDAIDKGLAEFESYVETRLTSPRAKAFFDGIMSAPNPYGDPVQTWAHACHRMELKA